MYEKTEKKDGNMAAEVIMRYRSEIERLKGELEKSKKHTLGGCGRKSVLCGFGKGKR